MEKKFIRDMAVGTKIKVPVDENGYFTYDYDGKYLASEKYVIATVINPSVIGWDKKANLVIKHGYTKDIVEDSQYATKFPGLVKYISISGGVPCIEVKSRKKPSTKFLFAALGAGAAMHSLFRETGAKAVRSNIRELSK